VVFPRRNAVDVEGLEPDVREGVEVVLAEEIASLVDTVLL
jgi:hypothetical protein